MNDILKQRLVGALILLALGVVFWPIIFVPPLEKEAGGQQAIPAPPSVATIAIESPDATGLRASPELAANDDATQSVDADAENAPAGSAVGEEMQSGSPAPAEDPGTGSTEHTATAAVRSEAPRPLAMDGDGVPLAWTLQVATVSSADKAETLRKRLLDMHQEAYVTMVSSGGKRLYRVCVGPKFERAELEKLKAEINAAFGVKTMVVRYLP